MPDDAEDRSDDHQHAVEACGDAIDALPNGDLSHTQTFLDAAQMAVEHVPSGSGERARLDPEGSGYVKTP